MMDPTPWLNRLNTLLDTWEEPFERAQKLKGVIIFGANQAEMLLKLFQMRSVKVLAVVDHDPRLWHQTPEVFLPFDNLATKTILPPEEVQQLNQLDTAVIIWASFSTEAAMHMRMLGFRHCWEFWKLFGPQRKKYDPSLIKTNMDTIARILEHMGDEESANTYTGVLEKWSNN